MNVDLNSELQAFVTEKVRSGEYHTPQAVVEDAVRLLAERARAEQRLHALVRNLKSTGTVAPLNEKDWEAISREAQSRLVNRASV
ncbi:MAG TPA: type II toxin-antitoxin system ParD family antitoxin [Terriglobia bacterium]|nr:type II toxin-antitoxin system ParD family antitoxin [Terriglobia bacterium]